MTGKARVADGLYAAALGLVLRLAIVVWAWHRIPPAADGTFYDTIARRIATGQGYTWRWPDGTVTYAAHYPVGYPALVAFGYRVLGAQPGVAMALAAVLGAIAVFAVHRVVARGGSRRQALAAALLLAMHPGLVSYTPALMTEGVTSSLVALAMFAFVRAEEVDGHQRLMRALVLGLTVGVATYLRPQCIVLAPLLGLLLPLRSSKGFLDWAKRAFAPALIATAVALITLAPWTLRNCNRMGRCALVSVNGGWNLLIGTDAEAHGSWAEVKVPPACSTVFDEAEKDACFGREAEREIIAHPAPWLSLVPAKLGATFDYAGAGPWYLHAANPEAFPYSAKVAVGGVEVVFERLLLLAGLGAVIRRLWLRKSPVDRAAAILALLSAGALFSIHAYFAVLGLILALAVALFGGGEQKGFRVLPPVFAAAWVVLGSTTLIHAVFFGAGRYSLVVFPVFVALAPFALGQARDRDIRI